MGTLSSAAALGAGQVGQVVAVGGNLYMVARPTGATGTVGVWKSTDDGATWTEQDTSNRPTALTASSVVDALAWALANGSAHDPTTVAGDVTTESLPAANDNPNDVAFHTSGTKMYVLDGTDDVIYEYPLSTAWDLSTKGTAASGSLNVSNSAPQKIAFNGNGTKVFCLNLTADLWEYSLSTAWDITSIDSGTSTDLGADMTGGSASTGFSFNDDGTKLYAFDDTQDDVYEWTLSTAYDISTKGTASSGSQNAGNTAGTDMLFSTDGTTLWVLDTNDGIYEYPLSTAWDISSIGTGTLVGGHFGDINEGPQGWTTKTDGTAIYWVDNAVTQVVYEASLKPVISVIYGGDTATGKNAAGQFRYAAFDTNTDVWTAVDEQIDTPDWSTTEFETIGGCDIAVRSDGDVVAVYRGTDRSSMGSAYRQVGYNIRSGGTWGGWTGMNVADENQNRPRCVLGSSDDTHIIYWLQGDATYGDTLSSADALGTRSAVGSIGPGDISKRPVIFTPTSATIALTSETGDYFSILESAWPNGTVNSETFDDTISGSQTEIVWDGITGDDRIYALWPSVIDSDLYYDWLVDGDPVTNNFENTTEAEDAVTAQAVWATVYTQADNSVVLGYVFDNAGTLTWGEVELAAGGQTISVTAASETDTAQAVSPATTITVAVGAVSETETAQATAATANFVSTVAEVTIDAQSDPLDDSNHTVYLRAHVPTGTATIDVWLYEGTSTQIQTWQQALTNTETTYQFSVTNAASITNYADLRLRWQVIEDSGYLGTRVDELYLEAPSGGQIQNISVVLATETETAEPVAEVFDQTISVGVVSETEVAQPISVVASTSIPVGVASESETAQVVTVAGSIAVSVAKYGEAETVYAVKAQQSYPIGAASEAESAQPVGADLSVPVSAASETETAGQVIAHQSKKVLPAPSFDFAGPVPVSISVGVGVASETETAVAVTPVAGVTSITVTGTTETETAQPINVATTITIAAGLATEVETAQTVAADHTITVGVTAETETAVAVTPLPGVVLATAGVTSETETATAVLSYQTQILLPTANVSVSGWQPQGAASVWQAVESDDASYAEPINA